MGHIKYASDVAAPVAVAFDYTDNPLFVPNWMFGIADFVPTGDQDRGLGAVFATTTRLALWQPTATCAITEYRHNAVIGYTLRGRFSGTLRLRFDPLGYGRSVLTSEAEYSPPRGVIGRLVDAAVKSALRRTEARLRREIEQFHGTDLVGRIA
ncbi:SRPBCC family protein [Nocardia sp. R7R-8]|uniref:SRPBCC family protein n=1 Tax=Nocardia sp. R7R-8 TaxID=3459304 RepID=UPI00403DF90E